MFKERGEEAIMKELRQVHDMEGFEPKHWHDFSTLDKALKYLMMLLTLSLMCLGKAYESDLAVIRHRLYENQSTVTNFALYESPKIKGG